MRRLYLPLTLAAITIANSLPAPFLNAGQPVEKKQRLDANGDPLPANALLRLGTIRMRHGRPVTGLAFSSDGKKLISVSDNLETHCWHVGTAKEAFYRKGAKDDLNVAMSSDGRLLAINKGKVCELRNTLTKELLHKLPVKKEIIRLGISPDTRIVAILTSSWKQSSFSYKLSLWNTVTGKKLQTLAFWPDSIVAFSRDSRLVAYLDKADSICLWNLTKGMKMRGLSIGHQWGMRVLAFSWKGDLLAAADGTSVRTVDIWNVKTGKKLRQFKIGEPRPKSDYSDIRQLAFGRDDTLAVGESSGEITLWNPRTGKQTRRLNAHQSAIAALAFSPDGKRLASGGYDNTIRLWDTVTGKDLFRFAGHQGGGINVEFLGDNRTICSRWDLKGEMQRDEFSSLRFWDAETGKLTRRVTWDKGAVSCPLVQLPTMTLALGRYDGRIEIRDLKGGKKRSPLKEVRYGPWSMQLSPGGAILAGETVQRKLFVSGDKKCARDVIVGRTVHLWNVRTGRNLGKIKLEANATFVLSPDEDTLVSTTLNWIDDKANPDKGKYDVQLQTWSAMSGKKGRSIKLQSDRRPFISFLTGGKLLRVKTKTSGKRSRLLHWDLSSGDVVAGPEQAGIDCDGYELASNGKIIRSFPLRWAKNSWPRKELERVPNEVLLREALTGLPLQSLKLPKGIVKCTGFSSDGQMLAVASDVGEIYLWDVGSGKQLAQLPGHRGSVSSVSFSRDGKKLCSGSDDTTILIWDIAPFHMKRSKATLSQTQFDALWNQLADRDAKKAYAAVARLVQSPGAIALLKQKLQPAPPIDRAAVRQALLDLESERFAARARAEKQLVQMAELVEPMLREELRSKPALEMHLRIQQIIAKIQEQRFAAPHLQRMRGVQALEWIGDRNAAEILAGLAKGNSDAWLTQEARRTLERIRKRGS